MAGNDTEGLRYATTETPEKYYLKWKEDSPIKNKLDRDFAQYATSRGFWKLSMTS